MQMRHVLASTILSAAVCSVPLYAADDAEKAADRAADKTERTMDKAGDKTERTADKAADRMDHTAEKASDKMNQAGDRTAGAAGSLQLPQGITMAEGGDDRSSDLRGTLSNLVEAAHTEDGFDDMVERLVDQDRNRIGKDDLKYEQFNTTVNAFRANWKAKYGKEFDLDEDQSFTGINVVSGEVTDPQVAMMHWPVKATGDATGAMGVAQPAGAGMGDKDEDAEDRIENANLDKGRDVALARIDGDQGKHLTLSFIDEAGGWKLDLPNNISGDQLLSSVIQCVEKANSMKDQWPADENQAKQKVSQQLLMSIYGHGDDKSSGANAGADAQKANVTIQGDQ
jgi:hypothetical protein